VFTFWFDGVCLFLVYFSVLDCVTVLHLFRAVFSTLTVSMSCPTACLSAFKLFVTGQIKMDGLAILFSTILPETSDATPTVA